MIMRSKRMLCAALVLAALLSLFTGASAYTMADDILYDDMVVYIPDLAEDLGIAWPSDLSGEVVVKVYKDFDAFRTGIPGAVTTVTWRLSTIDLSCPGQTKGIWYIAEVYVRYPDNSFYASITAKYDNSAKPHLINYTIEYRYQWYEYFTITYTWRDRFESGRYDNYVYDLHYVNGNGKYFYSRFWIDTATWKMLKKSGLPGWTTFATPRVRE